MKPAKHYLCYIVLLILATCTIVLSYKCETLPDGQQVCFSQKHPQEIEKEMEEDKEIAKYKEIEKEIEEGKALHNLPEGVPQIPGLDAIPKRTPEEQDEMDHYWISYVHAYATERSPAFPFGGAIVDARTNKLVCIGSNQIGTGSNRWSKFHAHGEMVAMENCSLPLSPANKINKDNNENENDNENDNNNDNKGGGGLEDGAGGANHEEWKYMIMYGNIEACPMCAQAAIWRGLRRMVFGARAIKLAEKRCWTQSLITAAEVVEKSSHWAPFEYVRGPLLDLEDSILVDFRDFCPKKQE